MGGRGQKIQKRPVYIPHTGLQLAAAETIWQHGPGCYSMQLEGRGLREAERRENRLPPALPRCVSAAGLGRVALALALSLCLPLPNRRRSVVGQRKSKINL